MLKVGGQVGCDATALEKLRRPERGAPVSYPYSFEDLLALLHGRAPAKVDAVALHRRRVEHGHLSVGLKIHCLGWPAPGSEDTELGVLMEPEVGHGETEVHAGVQA